ncbi:MAG: 50S ribosomal protein L4, partial [Halobacteria archaeon]|nr:50S ribosomal protein L4 [Halobacteria archaeon]
MEVNLRMQDGTEGVPVELPDAFDTEYRPDLIRRAFLASQANSKQPYGADEFAGLRTSAESWGSGRGAAHVPRIKNGNRAARVPHVKGGRRAHPPKVEKDRSEDVNEKERKKATRSAVAATANTELVEERGHDFGDVELPVVLDSEFEDLVKTQEVVEVLEDLELHADIERADEGRNVRSGRGTTRGRKYRTPNSVLFVTSDEFRAARNLAGADVVEAENLGIQHLAPGGVAGRLTVWTQSGLEAFENRDGGDEG